MKKFKEWLSDYLRYILLIIGALLAFTLITFGVQTWLIVKKAGSPQTANTQTEEPQAGSSKGGAIEILKQIQNQKQRCRMQMQPAVRLLAQQLRQMRPKLLPRQQHRPILP